MSDPGRGPGATPPSRPCRSYRRLPVGSSAPLDRSPAGSCQAGPVTQQPWRDENIEVSLLVFGAVLVYPPALFCVRPLTSEVGRRTSTRGRQRSTGVHCASCPAPDHAPCRSDRPRNARRLPVRRAPTAGASTQERRRWPRTAARLWAQPGPSPDARSQATGVVPPHAAGIPGPPDDTSLISGVRVDGVRLPPTATQKRDGRRCPRRPATPQCLWIDSTCWLIATPRTGPRI